MWLRLAPLPLPLWCSVRPLPQHTGCASHQLSLSTHTHTHTDTRTHSHTHTHSHSHSHSTASVSGTAGTATDGGTATDAGTVTPMQEEVQVVIQDVEQRMESVPQLVEFCQRTFPVRYDKQFFVEAFRGEENVLSLTAINPQKQLVGYSLVRIIRADRVKDKFLVHVLPGGEPPLLAYVVLVGCLPAYRRQGIATKLLDSALDAIAQQFSHVQAMYLHTPVNDPAPQALYRKLGFESIRKIWNYYFFNLRFQHALLYIKYLDGVPAGPVSLWTRLRTKLGIPGL